MLEFKSAQVDPKMYLYKLICIIARLQQHVLLETCYRGTDTVLIQEPWVYGDQIRGLCNKGATLCYTGPSVAPTACFFLLEIMFRTFHCWSSAVLQEPILESCEEDLKVN